MFSALKKLVAPRARTEPPIECIFSLDAQKRRLFLLDLKIVLRLPGARLALPNVANLETTVRRNRERVRIPYPAMMVLVKELLGVRHRIPPTSPLREIMAAIPGLVNTVMREPLPASPLMETRDVSIRLPGIPRAEQEAEVERIRKLIAQKPPLPPRATPAAPVAPDATAASAPAIPPAPPAPRPAGVTLSGNSRGMTALDQRRFLEDSADLIESVALSTHELPDEDFAGYVDLCILNGDHERVVEMLVERVAEQPRAWAWSRLLELLEAARDPRFEATRAHFHAWAARDCPTLIAGAGDDAVYGMRRDALRERERHEIGSHAMR